MHTRFMLVAALAATLAAPSGAEPAKAPAQPAGQAVNRPAGVLLAQADIRTPAPQSTESQPPATVKRPRAARVSACRCAGQLPEQP